MYAIHPVVARAPKFVTIIFIEIFKDLESSDLATVMTGFLDTLYICIRVPMVAAIEKS